MKPYEMAEEFHQIFDPNIPSEPTAFDAKWASQRAGFKIEEMIEFLYASTNGEKTAFQETVSQMHQAIDRAYEKIMQKEKTVEDPLVDEVDALVDLLYFTYGSFSLMGVDPEPMMQIVHEANMGKLFPDGRPHYDPLTNKVLKPANWANDFAPEAKIKAELARQKKEKN
ncbi:MAG: HAD family hydrolase [Enterococcus sp.]|nr:HAD family hydrolase [Enterococcus sp.]